MDKQIRRECQQNNGQTIKNKRKYRQKNEKPDIQENIKQKRKTWITR